MRPRDPVWPKVEAITHINVQHKTVDESTIKQGTNPEEHDSETTMRKHMHKNQILKKEGPGSLSDTKVGVITPDDA